MPLVLLGLTVAAIAAVVVAVLRGRAARRGAVPVAHSDRLTALPRFRMALATYRALLGILVVTVLITALAAGIVASRPLTSKLVYPENYSRDIVLCLDVSGSMVEYDAEVIEAFEDLVKEFNGERIALVLWNSSAAQVFPLTDDYEYLSGQLEAVRKSLEGSYDWDAGGLTFNYWNGTLVADGASLIGDGLASCVLRFDRVETERSRTIVLATDNVINGEPLLTFREATDLAIERGVKVYGINPLEWSAPREAREFEELVDDTGGRYYTLDDPDAIEGIVEGVLEDQASALTTAPVLEFSDVPEAPLGWALLAFLVLAAVGWRVRI
jgi:Ca-activated chloride channel family protein